jgi:hypothetical protein
MSRRLLLPCITLNILLAFAIPDRNQCYPNHTMTLLLGLLTLSCCAYVSIISSDAVTTNPDTRPVAFCCGISTILPSALKIPRAEACCPHRLVQRILCVERHAPLGESPTAREIW